MSRSLAFVCCVLALALPAMSQSHRGTLRTYVNAPTSGNTAAAQVRNSQAVPTSGFGIRQLRLGGGFATNQLVARLQW